LPFGGQWRELFNSDYYDAFPNPTPIGNGGWIEASGTALDDFGYSATITLPANGALFLAPA
jgi:1,4-alpha-glucan branching enzyme